MCITAQPNQETKGKKLSADIWLIILCDNITTYLQDRTYKQRSVLFLTTLKRWRPQRPFFLLVDYSSVRARGIVHMCDVSRVTHT
jgi:hypothetical protein